MADGVGLAPAAVPPLPISSGAALGSPMGGPGEAAGLPSIPGSVAPLAVPNTAAAGVLPPPPPPPPGLSTISQSAPVLPPPVPQMSGSAPMLSPLAPRPPDAIQPPGMPPGVSAQASPIPGPVAPPSLPPLPTGGGFPVVPVVSTVVILLILGGGGYAAYSMGLIPGVNQPSAAPLSETELSASPLASASAFASASPSADALFTSASPIGSSGAFVTAPSPSASVVPATPDEQRKVDIQAIASALDQYYAANSSVPSAPQGWYVPSSQASTLTTVLAAYLPTFPQDPSTTQSYMYASKDGQTYTVSALLESSSDPEGTTYASRVYYIIEGPRSTAATTPVDTSGLQAF